MDRSMIDTASGEVAKQLISNVAENFQQFGTRAGGAIKQVHEVSNLQSQISHYFGSSNGCRAIANAKVWNILALRTSYG
jgi:hypothetical protein